MTDYELLEIMTSRLDCTNAPKALLKLLGLQENERVLFDVSIIFESGEVMFEFNSEWYEYKTLSVNDKRLKEIFNKDVK
ncbi:MAG: hypothetical protein DRN17_05340 [Thermoplasmata archaeon]|nr:MAG: hypothetical protein DRN17_05340 [Thermoplasmata archaeon]